MKRNILFSFLYIASTFSGSAAFAGSMPSGNYEDGKMKSFSCQFCHGQTGVAKKNGYPHINNQNALYLYNSMKAYQKGERTGVYGNMMKQQLSVLTDQDLADIAIYFSEQP
ncbi:cytochrome c [Photobacterium sp. BZF1]|nr:cytochrome c [Photobacterium sp. BZF1]